MGYTHYWNNTNFTREEWSTFKKASRAMIQKAVFEEKIQLDREWDNDTEPPEINDELVAFNGRGDDGHETFYFERINNEFQFCKTASKPYDTAVVASLILAHYCNPKFKWTSDGSETADDFDAGIALANSIAESLPDIIIDGNIGIDID